MNEYELGTGVDYGVNLNDNTKLLSGQAWSGSAGWISFDADDLADCPEEPCEARVDTVEATGWAKVIDSDEWISLSGTAENEDEYGVELIVPEFYGWAWGDQSFGWISFNCENTGTCSTSDYKVYTSVIKLFARTDPATVSYNKDTDVATVTLNGMLLGMGAVGEADAWFEWGDSLETVEKDEDSVRTVTKGGGFSHELTFENPTMGSVYYFRAMAQSAERMTQGSILSFEISQSEGSIIIKYKGDQKTININQGGRIEIDN